MRITKKDVEKFEFNVGCAGSRAANRGSTAVGHTEECRRRIMEELEKAGDERVERERRRDCTSNWRRRKTRRRPRQRRRSGEQPGGGIVERRRWRRGSQSRGVVPVELTTERKADEDQQEQPGKKSKSEQE